MNHSNKNIIWLVSYPKSGNTWVRIFLNHILNEVVEVPQDFPSLKNIPNASNRNLIDRYLGVSSANLTEAEIQNLRPKIYRTISSQRTNLQILKVHDSFGTTSNGELIFPPDITRAAIYIARNPLDVVVSYSYHTGESFDTIIANICNTQFGILNNRNSLKPQIFQHLGTWSDHVAGWIDQNHFPIIFITFEQLLENSHEVFQNLLNKLEIPFSKGMFQKAIDICDFSTLKEMEAKFGFIEKPYQSESFFRAGKQNDYLNHLSKEQMNKIHDNHFLMMRRLGYLKISK